MLLVDSFSDIGSSHKICEDYILHGEDPIPYVVLSDGCSTSKFTDVGARILIHTFLKLMGYNGVDSIIDINKTIFSSEMVIELLNLPKECLDATLVLAFVLNDTVFIRMYGDGIILVKSIEGEIIVTEVEPQNNMPYYLSYLLNPINDGKFKKINNHQTKTVYNFDDNISNKTTTTEVRSFQTIVSYELKEFPTVLISSDGLGSFMHIEKEEVFKEILNFNGLNGPFVTKRVRKVIRNLSKQGIKHFDDISIGGFHFKED